MNCTPGILAQGDFNHDGVTDLVVPCNANNFLILLGDGKGGFNSPVSYVVNQPAPIAVGDLNGDGNADLAVVGPSTASLTILYGKSDGTFSEPVTMALPHVAESVQIADANGDGKADIILGIGPGVNRILALLGNGNGTFQAAKTSVLNNPPQFFMTGDFNGDGKTDLALVENNMQYGEYPYIAVLFGNGDGTFQPEVKLVGAPGAVSLVTGDFNKDGITDIAGVLKPSEGLSCSLQIFIGQSSGTFFTSGTYVVEGGASGVAAGDLNGDGNLDVAVANRGAGTVTTLLGKGDGTFGSGQSYPAAISPDSISIGDFLGNGRLAVAVDSKYSSSPTLAAGSVDLLSVETNGSLAAPLVRALTKATSAALPGDYNGDGKLDLLGADGASGIFFLAGNGNGTFQPAQMAVAAPAGSSPIFTADFNNDGIPDVCATSDDTGVVYLGNGDGTFHLPAGSVNIPMQPPPAFADLNDDGILDMVASYGGVVSIYLGKGDGTFQTGLTLPYPTVSGPGVFGDFNNDGKVDMIAFTEADGPVLLLGNGNGTFQAPVATSPTGAVLTADLNGDGNLDLVSIYSSSTVPYSVTVALGNGDGTFQNAAFYAVYGYDGGLCPAVADYNGDGKLDIACSAVGLTFFFLGQGDGTFVSPAPLQLGPSGNIAFGDFFGHRKQDVLTSFGSDSGGKNSGNVLVLENETAN